jgi:DNA-binding CsgD family transcriptional regulator
MAPMLRSATRRSNPNNLGFSADAPETRLTVMGRRERARNRCRTDLEAMAAASLDAEEARREAIAALRRAVGFERWCWPLTDPGSGLAMSGIADFDVWPSLPRLVALQQHGDVVTKPQLVRGRRASVALSAAGGGDLARSARWRECLRPYGIGDELMTACRDRHGCWGSVELMRDGDDAPFDEDDARFLHDLAPTLGALLRRGVVRSWRAGGAEPRPLPPATLILDAEQRATSWTAASRDWLAELSPDGADMLPPAVHEIAARVLAPAGAAHGLGAAVRLRASSGRWVTIEGAPLEGADRGRAAVTLRAASAGEVFDLLCRAHGLTPRERQLVTLMLDGLATRQLADALSISAHTVQDHLKAIFEKTGVRSRRELMSHLAGRVPEPPG